MASMASRLPQALLIGLGSTAAIALQTAVLVPFLRQAGFHFKARFDFRGVGLSHTLRLALWTLGFIVVNQIAFIVDHPPRQPGDP